MALSGGLFDENGEFAGAGKRVDMSSTFRQPTVEFVGECGSIGNGDKEGSVGVQDATNFMKCGLKLVEMFEAVVGNHGVKAVIGKWQGGGIALDHV